MPSLTDPLQTMPTIPRFARFFLLVMLSSSSGSTHATDLPQNLKTVVLRMGVHKITAQLATTPAQHTTGLMHRKSMPKNDGMLFVFSQPDTQCFWMKNTLLPLAAAFVLDNGEVVNIEEMQPETLATHCSQKPVRYVLEMNTQWFKVRGLKAGDRLQGLPL
jgi:uncharacterized protein